VNVQKNWFVARRVNVEETGGFVESKLRQNGNFFVKKPEILPCQAGVK
jgi:hypothetical protein